MNSSVTDAATPNGSVEISNASRNYALILLLIIYTSNFMDRQILNILIEPIKADLGVNDTQMGFLAGTAFAIFYATLGMPIAMAADRFNRRNIIAASLTIWSFMTMMCGMAGNFWQLAIARIGVGVGEAGGSPPSHSMIADLFPQEKRSTALAVFSLGVPFGILIGFMIGGRIHEWIGWRWAFIIVGAPGLLLAAIAMLTLREPPRGHSDFHLDDDGDAPKFGEVVKFILGQRSLIHLMLGCALSALVGYAGVSWAGSFYIRTHGLTVGEAGTSLALIIGIAGAIGTFGGGYLADHFGKTDVRWRAWVITATLLIIFPFVLAIYITDSRFWSQFFFIFGAINGVFHLGPSFAMTQSLVSLRMRALTSAILLFVLNMIGLGGGPQLAGILSDLYQPRFGADSMRYALLTLSLISLWAAFHFWRAGFTLKEDLEKVGGDTSSS